MPDDFVKNPPLKRQAFEMANSSALNESITTMITNIKSCEEPSIKDLVHLFTSYVELQLEKEKQGRENEERISQIEERNAIHVTQIHDLQEITYGMQIAATETTKSVLACEASIHKLEQLKIENDIFITHIPTKPKADEVSKKILELSNISSAALLKCYTFPMRSTPMANSTQVQQNNQLPNHAIVISFASHSDKVKFFTERKKLGPIKISQLPLKFPPEAAEKSIRISNRLSTFNLRALKGLNAAKTAAIIHSFQMHNGLFRIKQTETANWSYISNNNDLLKLHPQDVNMNTS